MVKLADVTDAYLVDRAAAAGWRRSMLQRPWVNAEGVLEEAWLDEGGSVRLAPVFSELPRPRRFAMRAALVAEFTSECPLCNAVARELEDGVILDGRMQTVSHGAEVSIEFEPPTIDPDADELPDIDYTLRVGRIDWWVIEHAAECLARPEAIALMEADE